MKIGCAPGEEYKMLPDLKFQRDILNRGHEWWFDSHNMRREIYTYSTQQSPGTQTSPGAASQTPLQKLVRRMTRVMVNTSVEQTMRHLQALFARLHYNPKIHSPNCVTLSQSLTTLDRRGANLVFKATLLDIGSNCLVDFRLSIGPMDSVGHGVWFGFQATLYWDQVRAFYYSRTIISDERG